MKIKYSVFCLILAFFKINAQDKNTNPKSVDDNTICDTSKDICLVKNKKEVTISWDDYFLKKNEDDKDDKDLPFLEKVEKIKQLDKGLTIYGYIPKEGSRDNYNKKFINVYNSLSSDDLIAVIVEPKRGNNFVLREKFLANLDKKWFKNFFKSASIMTIPYKIRSGDDDLDRITTSGLKNVAVNFDMVRYRKEVYYPSGKKLKFRFSIGAMVSPTVEEFTNTQRKAGSFNVMEEAADDEQNELFLSTGLTINFSFNDIAFSIIPAGYDFGTTTIGKSWNYEGRHWWGFGIGLSPKFLGPASSK